MPTLYRPFRSYGTSQTIVPRVKTKHGKAGFSNYATHSWNKLENRYKAYIQSRFKTWMFTFPFS